MNVIVAPIRVLLVEPHADTRELYDLGLTAAGFDVRTADDTSSATLAFASHAPTIVVTETRLPDRERPPDPVRGCGSAGDCPHHQPTGSSRLPRRRGGRRVGEALLSRRGSLRPFGRRLASPER